MTCIRCKKRPAVVYVQRQDDPNAQQEGYCLTCAKELGIKPVDDLMKQFGISDDQLTDMEDRFMSFMSDEDKPSFGFEGEGEEFTFGGSPVMPMGEQDEKENEKGEDGKRKPKKTKYLDSYCENLTGKARAGKVDRVVGRDKEIYRTLQILSRRQKNNPCLIGEAGVGKTAIAEGIALRIAAGDVPARLKNKEIYLLDLTALVAGTQFRGQFESRVKGLLSEVRSAGNIILFIDEIHNITGAGDSEGAMNAANIMKPALSRGEIQVIGATTFAEYRKYIEKDQALERRFQPVRVEEPSIADAVEVIRGVKEYYEKHHCVQVSDEIVLLVTNASERYITDRYLPDKAIDLLDEACACCSLRHPEITEFAELTASMAALEEQEKEIEQKADADNDDYKRLAEIRTELTRQRERQPELMAKVSNIQVEVEDVAKVVELWTGIPAVKIEQNEFARIASLEDELKAKVIGQDEACHLVAKAIKRTRAGISGRRRPASFIFVGPTGVGKTELVKQLASQLFDTVDPLIRLDMSEFMEKHSVSRLVGSPPGYIGYDEAGQLTEKVRRKPYSVILFDEIEKAHPDVMNLLLQILDEGKINDAHGRTVNFENTVIAMTSNAGSADKSAVVGYNKTTKDISREKMLRALREFLRPEFLARVDEVVCFNPLMPEDLEKIAGLALEEYREPLAEKGIALSYTPAALTAICAATDSTVYGARDLRKTIRKEVEDEIAGLIIGGKVLRAVHLDAGEDGKLVLSPTLV